MGDQYKLIKHTADADFGVVTQCLKAENIGSLFKKPFASNIAIKVNAKLGGINNSLDKPFMEDKKTIFFGADVTHPGVADANTVAAVVASMDRYATKYSSVVKAQPNRQEIIEELDVIVEELLRRFRSQTKSIPTRIVFFRDGVGESQMWSVYQDEVDKIKKACKSLNENYKPKITFIIAQKRHSIRFKVDRSDEKKTTLNPMAGLCVTEVGSPDLNDFFLVSHKAIQGTARPARYQIIYDENNLENYEVMNSIFKMTHLYARATKSVSVVTPVYYAHHAAARAKLPFDRDSNVLRPVNQNLNQKMYFL